MEKTLKELPNFHDLSRFCDNRFFSFIYKTIIVIIFAGDCVQEFEQRPMNKSVIEGQNVMLECAVRDLAGALQWSKGGIMLGNNF